MCLYNFCWHMLPLLRMQNSSVKFNLRQRACTLHLIQCSYRLNKISFFLLSLGVINTSSNSQHITLNMLKDTWHFSDMKCSSKPNAVVFFWNECLIMTPPITWWLKQSSFQTYSLTCILSYFSPTNNTNVWLITLKIMNILF